MIGLVLVAHNRVAGEMLKAAEHVLGPLPQVSVLDVSPGNATDQLRVMLQERVKECESGHGVLILVDIFGGTPSNVSLGCLKPGSCEVLAGFNLPMLIKAASLRAEIHDLSALAHEVAAAGRQHIYLASEIPSVKVEGS